MKDVFESNGFLPLQYIINADKEFDDEYYKKNTSLGNRGRTVKFFRSDKYQTEHLIHVGIWKSVSNLHS